MSKKRPDILKCDGEKYIHESYSKMLQEIILKLEKQLERYERAKS